MHGNYQMTCDRQGVITYRYKATSHGGIVCTYHLLCEVGERYQAWFKQEIVRRGWMIVSKDAPRPIHWADYRV